MSTAVILSNGKSWLTRKAALSYFQQMLARYSDDQVVDSAQDHDDLSALLERYDLAITNGQPKAGTGIDHFERRRIGGGGFSTVGFWVIRRRNDATDFSYDLAVRAQPKSDAHQFTCACRAAVQLCLLEAKKRAYEDYGDESQCVPCEITGRLLTFEEARLDHVWMPFSQIVVSFRASRGWSHGIPKGTLTTPVDSKIVTTFQDPSLAEAFVKYHNAVATLRIVSKGANPAMLAGHRQQNIQRPIRLFNCASAAPGHQLRLRHVTSQEDSFAADSAGVARPAE